MTETVLTNARVVLADRKATLVDEDAILDAAAAESRRLVERLGLEPLLATPSTFWRTTRATDQIRDH